MIAHGTEPLPAMHMNVNRVIVEASLRNATLTRICMKELGMVDTVSTVVMTQTVYTVTCAESSTIMIHSQQLANLVLAILMVLRVHSVTHKVCVGVRQV
jgi:hypothetical protein